MNKKIDLSSIKENDSVLVAIAMVFLAIVLGVAVWITFKETMDVQTSIDTTLGVIEQNNQNISSLRNIKQNREQYNIESEEYNAIIAEYGTYDTLKKQIELEDMLVKYNLTGSVQAGELEPYAGVQKAESTVEVIGKDRDIMSMCKELLSPDYIVRIDSFQIADNADGTVTAAFTVVNFTK